MPRGTSRTRAAKARRAGVWACGDRRTVDTSWYEKTLDSGRVSVVTIEKIASVDAAKGFLKFKEQGGVLEYMPRCVALDLAKPLGGDNVYYSMSESFAEPGDPLPITGKQIDTFNPDVVLKKLRDQGYVLTKTCKNVRGEFETTLVIPLDQTPLARLRHKR